MSEQAKPAKRLSASGVSVMRAGEKVIITASDEYEAGLLEDSLKDPELMALVLVTGALRKLPNDKSRFHALKLTEALLAAGEEVPAEQT
jgi:hypothetical protein